MPQNKTILSNQYATQQAVAHPAPRTTAGVETRRPIWIPWPLAFLLTPLFWVMPKTVGPHLANVRWPGVFLGQAFWIVYGTGCLRLAEAHHRFRYIIFGWIPYLTGYQPPARSGESLPEVSFSDVVLSPLAVMVQYFARRANHWDNLLLPLGYYAIFVVSLILVSIVFWPWVTTGERLRSLFGRSAKLVLWSSTVVVPIGLYVQFRQTHDPIYYIGYLDDFYLPYAILMALLTLRGAGRYAGNTQPQQPPPNRYWHCDQCGYSLHGLDRDTNCPECGQPIRESLPGYRRSSLYARATNRLKAFAAFFATARQAIFSKTFFKKLAVGGQLPKARRFAFYCAAIAPLIFIIIMKILSLLWIRLFHLPPERFDTPIMDWIVILVYITIAIFILMINGLTILFCAFWTRTFRRLDKTTTAACYGLTGMPLFPAALGSALFIWNVASFKSNLSGFPELLVQRPIYLTAALLPLTIWFLSLWRTLRGIRQTKFANE